MSQPPIASHGLTRRAYAAASRTLGSALRNMAIQDWVVAAFHGYMWLRVTAAPDSPEAEVARRFALALLTGTIAALMLTRGEILPPGRLRALVYRVGVFAPMVMSYLELRYLLPSLLPGLHLPPLDPSVHIEQLHPELLDMQLKAVDEALFGVTPSVWLAQFNTRPVVEWFSFFYYGYFYILGIVLLPSLFFDRGRRLQELMAGAMVVCCGGHVVYTLVPGIGPWATLEFAEPLQGGVFYELVWSTVGRAGAGLDIFPSLHTAYPMLFSIFAVLHYRDRVYKYTWPLIVFFTANMIIATMLLRWHWGIDVIAGITLAAIAARLGRTIARHEQDRGGADDDRQPVWEPLWRRQQPSAGA